MGLQETKRASSQSSTPGHVWDKLVWAGGATAGQQRLSFSACIRKLARTVGRLFDGWNLELDLHPFLHAL